MVPLRSPAGHRPFHYQCFPASLSLLRHSKSTFESWAPWETNTYFLSVLFPRSSRDFTVRLIIFCWDAVLPTKRIFRAATRRAHPGPAPAEFLCCIFPSSSSSPLLGPRTLCCGGAYRCPRLLLKESAHLQRDLSKVLAMRGQLFHRW